MFCVTDVSPGKYHLLFVNRIAESLTSFVYFPGVTKLSEATTIEVGSARSLPDLVFTIPVQPTVSVSGAVSTSSNSRLPVDAKVMLVSASQPLLALAYAGDVATNGFFVFRQVLPGKYWAVVAVDAEGESKWWTRKVRVDVHGDIADLSLELNAN